jgi:hypothetical protein
VGIPVGVACLHLCRARRTTVDPGGDASLDQLLRFRLEQRIEPEAFRECVLLVYTEGLDEGLVDEADPIVLDDEYRLR